MQKKKLVIQCLTFIFSPRLPLDWFSDKKKNKAMRPLSLLY